MTGKAAAPLGLLFFGGIVLLYFVLSGKTYELVDELGVRGCTLPFLREKVVPWHEIQQMEVITKRSTLGNVASMTAVLKDASGAEQARVFLQPMPAATRSQFLQVVLETAGLQKAV